MYRKYVCFLITIVLFTIVSGCSQSAADLEKSEIHISAASSLTSPLKEIKKLYEKENPGINLIINYGSSGALVNQLDQGAPADAVILASQQWMEKAIEKNIAKSEEVRGILSNQLVLAAPEGSSITGLSELKSEQVQKIAVGDPESVPVGSYTKQTLTEMEEWENLQEKMVMAKSARQVAVYLESGNVDAGFIFKSDLKAFPKLKEIETIPDSLHEPIIYPAAPLNTGGNQTGGKEFLDYLSTQEAISILEEYGFKEIR